MDSANPDASVESPGPHRRQMRGPRTQATQSASAVRPHLSQTGDQAASGGPRREGTDSAPARNRTTSAPEVITAVQVGASSTARRPRVVESMTRGSAANSRNNMLSPPLINAEAASAANRWN